MKYLPDEAARLDDRVKQGATRLGWTDKTPNASTAHGKLSPRFRRRKRRPGRKLGWLASALTVIAVSAGAVYYVFFRAYDEGPRTVDVNGEKVQQINGLLVHSKTWLSRSQTADFLKRIDASKAALTKGERSYNGRSYIRASDFAADLNRDGERSKFSDGRLSVTLKVGQHYSYQSKGNQIQQSRIQVNGKWVQRFLAVYHNDAPYISAETAVRILSQAGLKTSWDGHQMSVSLTETPSLTPVPKSAADHVIAFGPGKAIYAPSFSWQGRPYLPLYSLNSVLHQLGWEASVSMWNWELSSEQASMQSSARASTQSPTGASAQSYASNTQSGVVTPLSLTTKSNPQVLAFVPFYAGNMAAFKDATGNPSAYNALAEDIWTIDSSGNLKGAAPAGTATKAVADGYSVYAMVTNLTSKGFDAKEMTSVLTSSVNRTRLQNQLLNLVESEDYDGIMLDFEAVPTSDRQGYTQFVSSLAADLHAEGKRLEVAVPAITSASASGSNNAYDLAKLGQAADEIVVMAYDYSYFGGPAGPIAPIPWVQQVLAYAVSQMPSAKVVLGLDAYGYDWTGKHTTAVSLTNVDSFMKKRHIQPKWDKSADAPWFQWTDSKGKVHTVYYESGQSTEEKLKLASAYGADGVAVWRAGLADNAVLKVLARYKHKTHP